MLSIQRATVRFGAVPAVDGVDLDIVDGTVLALLGPSGCGKSTLLRAIAGLEPLNQGRIAWDGKDLATVPIHRRGVGLMFQDGVLFPHRTVAGNIGYGLARHGVRGAQAGRRIVELLELVGLPGYGDRAVQTLSGGQAQRVALARALAPRPALLLLDEPLAALDRSLRDRLAGDLRTVLTATGTTALFVTHDQQEAFAVADELAVMDRGRLRQVGPLARVRAAPVDAFVAGFVGYPQIADAAPFVAATGLRLELPAAGAALALGAGALMLDADGPIAARCIAVRPGPDAIRVTVVVPGLPPLTATAGPGAQVEPDSPVRLRVDPSAVVVLPAKPTGRSVAPGPEAGWQAETS